MERSEEIKRPTLLVLRDGTVDAESTPLEVYAEVSGEDLPTDSVGACYRAITEALDTFLPCDPTERMLWAGLKAMRDELIEQRPSLVPELLH